MPAIRSMWMNFLSIPIRFHDLVLLCISSSVAFSFPSTTAAAVVIFIVVVVVVVVAVVIAAATAATATTIDGRCCGLFMCINIKITKIS